MQSTPHPQDPALTTEVAEVHAGLQPGDQSVDVGVVELQALQEGDGSVLPSRLQQIQQVPLGEKTVSAHKALGGLPLGGTVGRWRKSSPIQESGGESSFPGSPAAGALTALGGPVTDGSAASLQKGQANVP